MGEISGVKKNWTKYQSPVFSPNTMDFWSWSLSAIFDVSMNVASKLLALIFKTIKATTGPAHSFPCKICTLFPVVGTLI